MQHIAPAGTPLRFSDLLGLVRLPAAGRDPAEGFRERIRERYGVRHCQFVSTGRAAFALVLEAMRELADPRRDEVIVPSYTCYSVPASVVRAGLKVRVVDVDPRTLDYDPAALERADFDRVLCVASANLYGIPNDLPRICAIARARGAMVLDDAAQSMEATVGGRASGTLGDAGIFSLDKGKNITTIDGGVVVTCRDDLGQRIAAKVGRLPSPPLGARARGLAKLLAYSIFLDPRLYWIPERITPLGLGTTRYPDHVAIDAYPAFLAGLGARLFDRIGAITATRVANARAYRERLKDVPGLDFVEPRPASTPVYLRFPVMVRSRNRDRVVDALRSAGIGASGSYPAPVPEIADVPVDVFRGPRDAPGGRWVAEHVMTLPTHAFVTPSVQDRVVERLTALLGY